ncbi:MAG TPA: hypothetical protein VFH51_10790 [Myxococcota bacterium]|nr:hypothetical protein [Myxococcota bacterium]
MKSIRHFLTGIGLAAALLLGGCSDPCKDLSERICNCKSTVDEQRACLTQVSNLASQRQSDPNKAVEREGLDTCKNLLATCTCAALAEGNLSACGLAYAGESAAN